VPKPACGLTIIIAPPDKVAVEVPKENKGMPLGTLVALAPLLPFTFIVPPVCENVAPLALKKFPFTFKVPAAIFKLPLTVKVLLLFVQPTVNTLPETIRLPPTFTATFLTFIAAAFTVMVCVFKINALAKQVGTTPPAHVAVDSQGLLHLPLNKKYPKNL
jgi:hypothetical protein